MLLSYKSKFGERISNNNLECVLSSASMTDSTVDAVVERSTIPDRFIPAWNKNLNGLQVVILDLAVCICDISMFVKKG